MTEAIFSSSDHSGKALVRVSSKGDLIKREFKAKQKLRLTINYRFLCGI